MARYVPTYEMGKRFGQREHRLDLVLECIEQTAELGPGGNHPASAVDAFVGYLFLDALVGNTDRHHENWAVIRSATQQTRLAPSYDHASSLGRELQDKRRMDKLRSRGIGHYLAGGGGGLFTGSAAKAPPPLNLLGELDSLGYGDYKSRWKAVVAAADIEELCGAICKIPPSWMSDEARTFATAIVRHQYQAITGS